MAKQIFLTGFLFLFILSGFVSAQAFAEQTDNQKAQKIMDEVNKKEGIEKKMTSLQKDFKNLEEEVTFLSAIDAYLNIKVLQRGLKKFEAVQAKIYLVLASLFLPLYLIRGFQRVADGLESWKIFVRNIIALILLMFFWDSICFSVASFFDITGEIMSEMTGGDRVTTTLMLWKNDVGNVHFNFWMRAWDFVMKILGALLIIYAYGMKILLTASRIVSLGIYFVLFRPVLILSLFPIPGFEGMLKKIWIGFIAVAMWPLYFVAVDALFAVILYETPVIYGHQSIARLVFCLLYGATLSGVATFTASFMTRDSSREAVSTFKSGLGLVGFSALTNPLAAGSLIAKTTTGLATQGVKALAKNANNLKQFMGGEGK